MEAFVELTFEYEIWRIGTLIQLNERDAYRILRATTSQKQIVAQEFKVSGLCFGVKIGGWAVPEDLNRQGLMH